MPPKKRGATRRSEPKVFRCTGFGDCNMVFTRSEHLARHARKHTGEKPFKCIVPECDRRFSRFDNMMQHTHTHDRNRKRGSFSKTSKQGSGPPERRYSTSSLEIDAAPLVLNRRASEMIQSRTLPPPEAMQCSRPQMPWPPSSVLQSGTHHQKDKVSEPPPLLYPPHSPPQHPLASAQSLASNPHLAWPPSTFQTQRRVSVSTDSSIDSFSSNPRLSPEPEPITKRRLSSADLCTPINCLHSVSLGNGVNASFGAFDGGTPQNQVDITADEYEALQGFGRFHAKPVNSPPPFDSPHLGSRVHTIRHRLSIQESDLRLNRP